MHVPSQANAGQLGVSDLKRRNEMVFVYFRDTYESMQEKG